MTRSRILSCSWVRAALRALLVAVLLGSRIVASPVASAADGPPEDPEPQRGEEWDWARLDTGEWLKGEVVVLKKNEMIFDSDKFDELEIDWLDLVELHFARSRRFRREDNRIFEGVGQLRDGVLRVTTAEGEVVAIPAREVVSITYTNSLEIRRWRMRVGGNLAARSGNTDQQDLGASASFLRDATFTRWDTRYNGAFGRVDDEQTTNNHRASTVLDFVLTSHFFLRIPTFEFYADRFQNIDARYTTGAGVGFEPIDTEAVLYRFSIGGAGQFTDFEGTGRSTDGALLVSSELELDLPRDVDFDLRYGLQLLVPDLDRTAHSTSAVFSFEFWDPFALDVGAYWDRIEDPEPDESGDRPKSDDIRLTVGISIEL